MTERPEDSHPTASADSLRREIGQIASEFWVFVNALWSSSGRRTFVLLSVGIVTVIIATSGMQIVLNAWNRPFYNAIEQKNVASFLRYLLAFAGIAGVLLALNVTQTWLDQTIMQQTRRWLTRDLIEQWLKPRRLVMLSDAGEIGVNPDQRVHEDARHLAELSAGLGIGLFQSTLLLISFVSVLWALSSGIVLSLAGHHFVIPGYMVWAALIYAATGSLISFLVGRPLIGIGVERYAREADLRFALVQVSENADGIVLNAGEDDERTRLNGELDRVMAVMTRLVAAVTRLTWVTSGYGWFGIVAPIIIAAPGYFGGQISFGALMMVVGAFNQVQNSLRWFVDNFSAIADWRATLSRVMSFRMALTTLEEPRSTGDRIQYENDPEGRLSLDHVTINWTGNHAVLGTATVDVAPGDHLLIVDKTGSGRGALFSALAGLWPWGSGKIMLPPRAKVMFLSERPYVPDGTLRAALTYPNAVARFTDDEIKAAMERTGLSRLAPSLDRKARWGRELSADEEDRVTFARLLLLKPEWVFIEQTVDAFNEEQRDTFCSIMNDELAKSALVTVSSRRSTDPFYTRSVDLVLATPDKGDAKPEVETEQKTEPKIVPADKADE